MSGQKKNAGQITAENRKREKRKRSREREREQRINSSPIWSPDHFGLRTILHYQLNAVVREGFSPSHTSSRFLLLALTMFKTAIKNLARECGCLVDEREPREFQSITCPKCKAVVPSDNRSIDQHHEVCPNKVSRQALNDAHRSGPDIRIKFRDGSSVVVDVTMTSHILYGYTDLEDTFTKREQEKDRKYRTMVEANQEEFLCLCCTCTGSLNTYAANLADRIAEERSGDVMSSKEVRIVIAQAAIEARATSLHNAEKLLKVSHYHQFPVRKPKADPRVNTEKDPAEHSLFGPQVTCKPDRTPHTTLTVTAKLTTASSQQQQQQPQQQSTAVSGPLVTSKPTETMMRAAKARVAYRKIAEIQQSINSRWPFSIHSTCSVVDLSAPLVLSLLEYLSGSAFPLLRAAWLAFPVGVHALAKVNGGFRSPKTGVGFALDPLPGTFAALKFSAMCGALFHAFFVWTRAFTVLLPELVTGTTLFLAVRSAIPESKRTTPTSSSTSPRLNSSSSTPAKPLFSP